MYIRTSQTSPIFGRATYGAFIGELNQLVEHFESNRAEMYLSVIALSWRGLMGPQPVRQTVGGRKMGSRLTVKVS